MIFSNHLASNISDKQFINTIKDFRIFDPQYYILSKPGYVYQTS